jgi:DNA-binding NarL/FixJ family response regulator
LKAANVTTGSLNMKDSLSILIIDEHRIAASGLSSLILGYFSRATVAICHCVEDAMNWAENNQFDRLLILTDFWLRGGTALNIVELFEYQKQQVKMIVLSGDEHPQLLHKLVAAGIWGFISKSASPNQLIELISQALTNSPSRLSGMSNHANHSTASCRRQFIEMSAEELGITHRQLNILHHILLGRSNKIIARELGIVEQTVKEHVTKILAHFKLPNRLELIRYFSNLRMTVKNNPRKSSPRILETYLESRQ